MMTQRGGMEGGGVVGGMFRREYMYTLVCILYCVCVYSIYIYIAGLCSSAEYNIFKLLNMLIATKSIKYV